MTRQRRIGLLLVLLLLLVAAAAWWRQAGPSAPGGKAADAGRNPSARLVEQGAYLARAGNCMLCHTPAGGAPYAGGRAIETPFGTVYSSNLTPDRDTGIGNWTAVDFWRAMHEGRSKDGRLLVPAFPYTSFTQVTQDDADALFAYLRSLAPVRQPNRPHALRWPYDSQLALAAWRTLYFEPAVFQSDPARDADWNRGAYLVRGLGHCSACHTTRNLLGAVDDRLDLAGGPMPMQNWYAPSLVLPDEAGVGDWALDDIVRLLQTGVSDAASVMGPMAEVVLHSTQYLSPQDLRAIAVYLRSLPKDRAGARSDMRAPAQASAQGADIYDTQCARCHGDAGQGVPGAYPALAGNRAVLMANTANLVQVVLHGGFAPATQGHPRPFGMPPYQLELDDRAVAAVLTHIRSAWGNRAAPVHELDVTRHRDTAAR
ncbi:MAG: cytochrome c [Rhodoferax sp.]|jgi:mono/diheme cytochrome c family protein|nr:cytochrome c [Rhodoferax sp.]MCP5263920.1 cytochrome c [Rhodoferax sp.]MCW5631276.1 cytochrome c [Rhodoferax sp.]